MTQFFNFAFTQQSPAFQAAARASPRRLSPVWVRMPHRSNYVTATVPQRRRFVNVDSLRDDDAFVNLPPTDVPTVFQTQITPSIARCLRRYSLENGIGNRWVTKYDVIQQRFHLDDDITTHHRVTVVTPEESKWVNLSALSPRRAAFVRATGINGGTALSGTAILHFPRGNNALLANRSPLVFSATQIPAMGLSLKEHAQPFFLVSNMWIPLRCAHNAADIIQACTAAGAVLPTDPFQPIDVTTGAPLQSPVRIRRDQDVPHHTVESRVLNRAQLQHFMLPSSVLGDRAPVKVLLPAYVKPTFKTLRTPASDAEVWYSVDSLTDPDMGFRVAGTYAAPGETLLTAAVDENTTALAPCDTTTV